MDKVLKILKYLAWILTVEGLLFTIIPYFIIIGLFAQDYFIYFILSPFLLIFIYFVIFTLISKKKRLNHFIFYPTHSIILKLLILFSSISNDVLPKGKHYFIIHASLKGVLMGKKKPKSTYKIMKEDILGVQNVGLPKNSVVIGNTFFKLKEYQMDHIKEYYNLDVYDGRLFGLNLTSKKKYYLYVITNKNT